MEGGVEMLRVLLVDVGGSKNHLSSVTEIPEIQYQIPAVDVGHSPVRDDEVELTVFIGEHPPSLAAVFGGMHGATCILKYLGSEFAGELSGVMRVSG